MISKTSRITKHLKRYSQKEKVKAYQKYFKTGKGEYGEGDIFIGVTVPDCRKVADKYQDMDLKTTSELIKSKVHEERLTALLILVEKFKKADIKNKNIIINLYLKSTPFINNWDLVDLSSPKILGNFLFNNPQYIFTFKGETLQGNNILVFLSKSGNLWERRIAILSTLYFINNNIFDVSLKIAKILLSDKHDLIHKAVGWMLREIGKRDLDREIEFLNKYKNQMPRTMLRYAIEKFTLDMRLKYLHF